MSAAAARHSWTRDEEREGSAERTNRVSASHCAAVRSAAQTYRLREVSTVSSSKSQATPRRHRQDGSLVAEGPDADAWLDIVQAFAGRPGPGRPPLS